MPLRGYLVGEVAQDCADGLVSRREALRRLGLLGVGLSSASTLLSACGGDDDDGDASDATSTPTTTPTTEASGGASTTSESAPGTSSVAASLVNFDGPNGVLQGAWATAPDPTGAVLLIHENRGLTEHFFDLTGRLGREGYAVLCVDLLSEEGGTPSFSDEAAATAALGAASEERLLGDLRAGIDELERRASDVKVGTVGFCFGGAMVWNLLNAGEDRLAAAVPFYGPAPAEPDFSGAQAAVLAIYGELDTRVNATREIAGAALQSAGLTHEVRTFAGADHAFFNETGPRYNEAAATEAYDLMTDWLDTHLA